jgi:hypothetical protein
LALGRQDLRHQLWCGWFCDLNRGRLRSHRSRMPLR